MSAFVTIVGQGLAGSLLGWELERAGVPFVVVERGGDAASSRVGAGIINPVTGLRLVKSWRVDAYFPSALAAYREIEAVTGRRIIHPMRVRRLFGSEEDARNARARLERGELIPYVREIDERGLWIDPAARIDAAALIEGLHLHWSRTGRLLVDPEHPLDRPSEVRVIRCIGAREAVSEVSRFARLGLAKGEIITIQAPEAAPDVIWNTGHWMVPIGDGLARVGATFDRHATSPDVTEEARRLLSKSAERFLGRSVEIVRHEAGLRVTSPDRHPVIGWLDAHERVGVFNALGSKGALLAPAMARAWVGHLTRGEPFDRAVDVARFR